MSGKGRTGTAIACLLFFTGLFDDMNDALNFYGWKRFSSGLGVSQPCQLRSIYYFEGILNKIVKGPVAKKLKSIIFRTVPRMSGGGCRPYFEISQGLDYHLIYSNKSSPDLISYDTDFEDNMYFEFREGEEPVLFGDVHFTFKHKGVMYDSQICRIAFNISFLSRDNSMVFTKFSVSPDGTKKDNRIDDQFFIKIIFEDYCRECKNP